MRRNIVFSSAFLFISRWTLWTISIHSVDAAAWIAAPIQSQPRQRLHRHRMQRSFIPRKNQLTTCLLSNTNTTATPTTTTKSTLTTTTTSAAATNSKTAVSTAALIPDGGLNPCVIRVLGVGGAGCNAVDRMLEEPIEGIEYWSINTDSQALGRSRKSSTSGSLVQTIQIGSSVTRGLGAGGDPEVGRAAAEESVSELKRLVEGSDLCFVAAGMGGGTGSGAAPVLAKLAKQAGALTVAIVTKPFAFEGRRRKKQAEDAIAKLRENVDTLILVSNDKLLDVIPEGTPLTAAFRVADDVLRQGVVGIAEIIVRPGLVNVDFADVRAVLQDAGSAIIGIGNGNGPNAAEDAAVAALGSPLLDENSLDVANGVVFNILGGPTMTLSDVNRAANVIYDTVTEDANVIFGASVDDNIADNEIFVTVLATGFQKKS